MKKILVPTDFSEQANHALSLAHQIARLSQAEIILLNVLDIPGGSGFVPGGSTFNVMGSAPTYGDDMNNVFVVQLHNRTKQQLEEIVNDSKYQDVNINYKIQIGDPYHNISEEIVENQVNLVIMGTKGSSGVEEVLIGSNTEKVVRLAKCPVLTVKKHVEAEKIKNIIFASNFKEDQENVVNELLKLQQLFKAKLHLVKINTPNNFETSRQIRKEIESFVNKFNIKDYTVNNYCDSLEEDGIIYFAEDINADLIALATHGRTGFMHLLSGSIAEDVVNHSKRPVWTYSFKNK
ncbi:MAG: universal stress protein [Candidatus Cyclobacteriaceae bacterium M3_2C_046]